MLQGLVPYNFLLLQLSFPFPLSVTFPPARFIFLPFGHIYQATFVLYELYAAHFLTLGIFYKLLYFPLSSYLCCYSPINTQTHLECVFVGFMPFFPARLSWPQVRRQVHKFAHWGVWVMCQRSFAFLMHKRVCERVCVARWYKNAMKNEKKIQKP